jgi:hypothetical protein
MGLNRALAQCVLVIARLRPGPRPAVSARSGEPSSSSAGPSPTTRAGAYTRGPDARSALHRCRASVGPEHAAAGTLRLPVGTLQTPDGRHRDRRACRTEFHRACPLHGCNPARCVPTRSPSGRRGHADTRGQRRTGDLTASRSLRRFLAETLFRGERRATSRIH